MSDRVVVIIGTGERDKALAGTMYAVNARKYGWLADVQLVFFGPSEALLLADEDLQEMVLEYGRQEGTALACRFVADRSGVREGLTELGVEVIYVGERISNLIRDGYVPMVW
ncbi:hypothetical protein KDM41_00520 [bacterium]|nr:hypothetical protein [bacterium]